MSEFSYDKALKVAQYIDALLRPHCEKLHIAGSIRRMRHQVKDIEIVCQPKQEKKFSGLFQEETFITDRNFTEALATITDAIIKGNVDGRYMQIKTNSKNCPGIYLDLFMPQPEDFYRMLAIRTGSADYAHHIIAGAWKRLGWVGVKEIGLCRIEECHYTQDASKKKTWHLTAGKRKLEPPVWKSEADFFSWIGVKYIDPQYRDFKKLINEAQ
jgi:DNA polymerase/3'-5' exonuclease PolX